jgi:hypothetical protein
VVASYSGDVNYAASSSACTDPSEAVSVGSATLGLSTQVSPAAITLGDSFSDTASLGPVPSGAAAPTGTVTFSVYGNDSCSGNALFSSTNAVGSGGTSASSDSFTPATAGTYHVIASYSGDGNYSAGSSGCADAKEAVAVSKATLGVSTQVSPSSITLGGSFTDAASIAPAPSGAAKPTGTVTFSVYGNETCSGAALLTSTNGLNAAGDAATSDPLEPATAGTYHVIARYSGDGNYGDSTSSCTDTTETVTVGKATLGVSTQMSDSSITLGDSFHDSATLAAAPSGAAAATGTVTFKVYGPGDTTCSAAPLMSSTNALGGGGSGATSDDFTPPRTGTYRVIATYSGDDNYAASSSACSDPSESVQVGSATPAVSTNVSPSTVTLGETFRDTASIGGAGGGADKPTGTVTFDVYGPGDDNCSGTAAFSSTNSVSSSGTTAVSDDFKPTAAGRYRVIARYSGDGNYHAGSTACADPAEAVTAKAQPAIATAASGSVTVGGSISDTATLSGGASPTGTITFKLYGPDDANCSGSPLSTSSASVDSGNGSYTSSAVTPQSPGTFRWVASYDGDAQNNAAAAACNDTGESVRVTPRPNVTPSQQPPTATTAAGTRVRFTSATLNGTVDGRGLATTYHFEYGRTRARGHSTRARAVGASGRVSAHVTGLRPGTRYHFRVVANTSAGAAAGDDLTFRTRGQTPTIVISATHVAHVNRGGLVTVPDTTVECPAGDGSCQAAVVLQTSSAQGSAAAASATVIARGKLALAPHSSGRLRLHLTHAGMQVLRRKGRLRVRAAVTAHNRAGRAAARRQGFTLIAPARRSGAPDFTG